MYRNSGAAPTCDQSRPSGEAPGDRCLRRNRNAPPTLQPAVMTFRTAHSIIEHAQRTAMMRLVSVPSVASSSSATDGTLETAEHRRIRHNDKPWTAQRHCGGSHRCPSSAGGIPGDG